MGDQLKKYRIDVAAVQEVRWPGQGEYESTDYTLYYSGHPSKRMLGVGFLVKKSPNIKVIEWKPINDRLYVIRIEGRVFNTSFICAHAPTEEKDDEVKEQFYDLLELTYDELPKADVRIVLGDFNAQIGRETEYRRVTGGHSLHEVSNDNGSRLINLASSLNLAVKSTWFPRKDIHKQTWISPDGTTRNQIDHMLIEGRHFSSILDVRTYRGADCDSDHMLVVGRYKKRTARNHMARAGRTKVLDVEKLSDPNMATRYQKAIEDRIEGLGEVDEDVETLWETTKNLILQAGQETVGFRQSRKKKQWYDDDCAKAIEARRVARENYVRAPTRRRTQEYSKARKEARKMLRSKKRAHAKQRLEELERNHQLNENRKFYRGINAERKGYQPRVNTCRDKAGNTLCEKEQIINRWAEYFEDLLNVDTQLDATEEEIPENNATQPEVQPPTLEEVQRAIQAQKNNKAPGGDGIGAELLKKGGEKLAMQIHQLVVRIWEEETIPEEWNTGIICPLHKKGDKRDCNNYRGITLLSVAYKVLSSIIRNRLEPYVEARIGSYQTGFRPGRSTRDQMFNIRQMMEKLWEYGYDLHHLFIDFKQAYDSVGRQALWQAMHELQIPSKYIRMVRASIANSKGRVRIQNDLSNAFGISCGLRQGDGMSPLLFNIVLEWVIRKAQVNTRGTIVNKSTQILAYADDIDVVTRNIRDLERNFLEIQEAAGHMGLKINQSKTKYMKMTSNPNEEPSIQIGQQVFENVKSFEYLGSTVTASNSVSEEIRKRITAGNRGMFGLSSVFRSKELQRSSKIKVYKTLLRPAVLYGCEAWTLTQANQQKLAAFERKVLRKIFGPIKNTDGTWRARYNHELKALYNEPDIVAVARSNRLRWAGHVARMQSTETPRALMEAKMYSERRRGRPRLRWTDDVQQDAERIGVRNWRSSAQNRTGWRQTVKEAMTHLGL